LIFGHYDTTRDSLGGFLLTHVSTLRYSFPRCCAPDWRNGRRGALKMLCPKGRVGSSPTSGTNGSHTGFPQENPCVNRTRTSVPSDRAAIRLRREPANEICLLGMLN